MQTFKRSSCQFILKILFVSGSLKLTFSEAIRGKGVEDLLHSRLKTVLKSGVEVEYSPLHLAIWLRYAYFGVAEQRLKAYALKLNLFVHLTNQKVLNFHLTKHNF